MGRGVRQLGDEDDVGAAGDAAVEGDPPGVTTHDLEDHGAVIAGQIDGQEAIFREIAVSLSGARLLPDTTM